VEDDENIVLAIKSYFRRRFGEVFYAQNGKEGLELYKKKSPDIVVSDILMPIMNGLEMIEEIRRLDTEVPIAITTAYNESNFLLKAIDLGVDRYISKPIDKRTLEVVMNKIATSIINKKEASRLQHELIQNYEDTIKSFADMIEQRDTYTAGHSRRVAKYSGMIAKELGFSSEEIAKLQKASYLHDIGKVQTPDSLLLKPGKLNDFEYSIIKEHVNVGYNMLSHIPLFKELAEIMRYHHEKYDGSGYPLGKKGDEIPLLAQIMSIADAFDAMTTNRIYKPRKSVQEAVDELESLKNRWYHPKVVDAASKVLIDIDISKEENISQVPKSEIEKERFSYFYKDQLTALYNCDYLKTLLNGVISKSE
jgi:putative nucleotidyltransferase with HDIG domain